jgi:Mg/Co/Ni transporter MgtE
MALNKLLKYKKNRGGSIMKTDKKMTSKSHWSVRNKYKEIEYKGYLIEKYMG